MKEAKEIINIVEKLGFEAYIVGGCVRDTLLNKESHDIDISTNCPIHILEKHFKVYDIGKSKDFGIVVVQVNNKTYEIAQFRSDGEYSNSRHPDNIKIVSSFLEDTSRRDFTINAMGINSKGNIIDYHNGKEDLENKVIRCVGNPNKRFEEDSLRIMRAVRFAAKYNFSIEKYTGKAMKKLSVNINKLSPERIKEEIFKAANNNNFDIYIDLLNKYKILSKILPEIANLKYLPHNYTHHPEGNVYQHTLAALKYSEPGIVRIAILFHDIGKNVTLNYKNGLPTYHGHDKEGISLFEDIANRLKFSNKEKEMVIFCIKNHMKFHEILVMKKSKVAKLVNSPYYNELLEVYKADSGCRGKYFKYRNELEKILDRISEIDFNSIQKVETIVSGNLIMELLNLKPSKLVGDIKKRVTEYVIDNGVDDIENAILTIGKEIKLCS
jgi:tRNA nucleotidyltransferase (CCA-adding enzyme)